MLEYNVDIQKIMQNQQKKAENGGGEVAVYVLYMCVSQDTLCAASSWIKNDAKYDS